MGAGTTSIRLVYSSAVSKDVREGISSVESFWRAEPTQICLKILDLVQIGSVDRN